MISIKEFIKKHTNESVANPQEGSYKGECVSLVQMYLYEVYGVPFKARGNAKDYCQTLINEGLAEKVTTPKYGDIMGWYGDSNIGGLGHVAIYIGKDKCFDQSNGTRKTAKERKPLAGVDIYVRMKTEPKADETKDHVQKFKIGEKVIINGNLYKSSTATKAAGTVKNKVTNITMYVPGAKNPYNTTGELGWMKEKDIKKYTETKIKAGDKVKVTKAINYDNGKTFALWYSKYDVMEIDGSRAVIGVSGRVTSAIDVKYLTKA